MKDWLPPGQCPHSGFSSTLADVALSSRSLSNRTCVSENVFSIHNAKQHFTSSTPNAKDGLLRAETTFHQTTKNSTPQQNTSSRGSLLERIANRAGFRPADLSQNMEVQSPYLVIPPGLSPTTLLESPGFLSNSLAQPCPTTGTFSFFPSDGSQSSASSTSVPNLLKEDFFRGMDISSLALEPITESGARYFGVSNKAHPTTGTFSFLPSDGSQSSASSTSVPDFFKDDFFRDMDISSFALSPITESGAHYFGVSNKVTPTLLEPSARNLQSLKNSKSSTLNQQVNLYRSPTEQDTGGSDMLKQKAYCAVGASLEQSSARDEQKDSETNQRGNGDPKIGGASAEEGYTYRKYGQKKVKGSLHPRSYYKCSYPDCPVKKKVEISSEGDISKSVYNGEHNHPKPLPGQKPTHRSWHVLGNMLLENDKQDTGTDGDTVCKHDTIKVTSFPALGLDYSNTGMSLQKQNGSQPELGDVPDGSSAFLHEKNDDCVTHGNVSLDRDGEGDESESKKRKNETHTADRSEFTRPMRVPKVIIQTISDVDILEDGYRWRKYGQKVVKGNPNPRSYYKCTNAGCYVRKHVERASHDLKLVITAYEGWHNHEVPT